MKGPLRIHLAAVQKAYRRVTGTATPPGEWPASTRRAHNLVRDINAYPRECLEVTLEDGSREVYGPATDGTPNAQYLSEGGRPGARTTYRPPYVVPRDPPPPRRPSGDDQESVADQLVEGSWSRGGWR